MFKFLKSKKGFTLVELMIVVVIMAILVAVAVPIYSAVTRNARIKTCAANRREIVSQVNNFLMGSVDGSQHNTSGQFTISSDGKKGTVSSSDEVYSKTVIEGLFQEVPYCPSGSEKAAATYTCKITAVTAGDDQDTTATVNVYCSTQAENEKHGDAAPTT